MCTVMEWAELGEGGRSWGALEDEDEPTQGQQCQERMRGSDDKQRGCSPGLPGEPQEDQNNHPD